MITNDIGFMVKLDNRIRSRLIPDLIEFKPYNNSEIREILRQRMEYAFVQNTINKESFEAIVNKTCEIGDMRTGLFLLKESGEVAENNSSQKILLNHINTAIGSLIKIDLDESDNGLESFIELVKEHSGKSQNEIFKVYENKTRKSYRTFQRKIKELKEKDFIKIKEMESDFGKQAFITYLK